MDVAIAAGRIAAFEPNIAATSAAQAIDARGKLVVPGLIDIHTHARSKEMPAHLPVERRDGVRRCRLAGRGRDRRSRGGREGRAEPRAHAHQHRPNRRSCGDGELMDINRADVAAARQAIERHRDVIVGVKARLSRTVVGANDLEALRRAQARPRPFGLPVMIHIGQTVSPLPKILALLKRGDIVTHMYAPPPHGMFDETGACCRRCWRPARAASGSTSATGGSVTSAGTSPSARLKQGFLPDTISSDWTDAGRTDRVFDFPNVLSKFLMLGMPLDQVIACGTSNAARAFPAFKDRGTLRVGAPADVAVLELQRRELRVRRQRQHRSGPARGKLVATAAVIGGKRIERSRDSRRRARSDTGHREESHVKHFAAIPTGCRFAARGWTTGRSSCRPSGETAPAQRGCLVSPSGLRFGRSRGLHGTQASTLHARLRDLDACMTTIALNRISQEGLCFAGKAGNECRPRRRHVLGAPAGAGAGDAGSAARARTVAVRRHAAVRRPRGRSASSVLRPRSAIAVRAGRLFDSDTGQMLTKQVVLILGERITEVGPEAQVKIPAGAQVIDLSQATVLPGLIDAHTHMFNNRAPKHDDGAGDADRHAEPAGRPAGRLHRGARHELARQRLRRRRHPQRHQPGRHRRPPVPGVRAAASSGAPHRRIRRRRPNPLAGIVVRSADEGARRGARADRARRGLDQAVSRPAPTPSTPPARRSTSLTYPLPVLQALIDETHRLGQKAACHVFGGEGLQNAIIAGCDTIEHGYGLTQAQLDMMVQKGLYYDPTLVRYTEPYMDDNDAKNTGGKYRMIPIFEKAVTMAAATKGIKIMVGSGVDGSTYPHGTQALEFEALVKRAGMTPARAIQAGTIVNAEAMGWQDEIGSITKGQVRRSGRGVRRSARRHHRAAARQVRDEGRQGHQE